MPEHVTTDKTTENDKNLIICWSGDLGKKVAEAVKKWLEQLDGTPFRPWYSEDIVKGADWRQALKNRLQQVKAGIICVTPSSLGSPWLHYEAGFLAGGLAGGEERTSSRVFPLLFRVDRGQLAGPLGAYQATTASRQGVELLVRSLAELVGAASDLPADWEGLKRRLDGVGYETIDEIFPGIERLFRTRSTLRSPCRHRRGSAVVFREAQNRYPIPAETIHGSRSASWPAASPSRIACR